MKTIKQLLITVAVLLYSVTASAHDFEVDGIYYKIISESDLTVEVTYKGRSYNENSNEYSGELVIPVTVIYNAKTYCVTNIENDAFHDCTSLTNVTIGNSVTNIENDAFHDCTSLTNVTIGNSVTNIGRYAFNGCTSLTSVTIPNNVITIGTGAFYDCTALTRITIGNSVTSIGSLAFKNCSKLAYVTIPNSVTTIGSSAFSGCKNLASITIPNSLTTIKNETFYNCYALKIQIPASVKTIEDRAFINSEINALVFEAGTDTITIGHDTSYGKPLFNSCKIDSVFINRNIKSKDNYRPPFEGNISLKFVEIGENVTYIPTKLFNDCSKIVDFQIKGNLEFIGEYAFGSCTGIKEVKIGNPEKSRATISRSAFYNCKNLKSVEINNAVIESYAFYNCSNLVSLTIDDKSTSIGTSAFQDCTSLTKLKTGNGIKAIENHAFYNCSSLTEITLGKRINYIGQYAFYNCENIDILYALPKNAINCGEDVFSDNVYKYATLYVKESSIDSYDTNEPWSKFYIDAIGEFNLIYVVDGDIYKEKRYEFDDEITTIIEPTKEGYTFSGWSEVPKTMPAEDIVIEGSFSLNSYTATFIIDGEVYETRTIEYSAKIELPTPPEKEGYTFCGWNEIPKSMPAEDIVIEGNYIEDTTGIKDINCDFEHTEFYNLNGQRITETENITHGIYIIRTGSKTTKIKL